MHKKNALICLNANAIILFIIDRLFFVSEAVDNTVLAAEDTISADEQNEMGKILLYLHLNYGEKISLSGLTKAFNINRTSLNRQFGRETGSPVMTYLIRLRIRLACALLRDTALPVSEILERVGFMDEAHFSRMFRKYAGCSPTEYRQNYCWLLS